MVDTLPGPAATTVEDVPNGGFGPEAGVPTRNITLVNDHVTGIDREAFRALFAEGASLAYSHWR
ncbi:hypothetical protein [Streptosporangium jomthongense]|uniref:hypothetical protein n=1 Tax=Streptosporangium jomthongense TaxID=1193683 RepID=UPI0036DAD382